MARVTIPVAQLEYEENGDTMWIHSPKGGTVLRIKLLKGKFRSYTLLCENICSHVNMVVVDIEGPSQSVFIALAKEDKP